MVLLDIRPVTQAQFETLRKRYDWLWNTLIASRTARPKASLCVVDAEACSGYRAESNQLLIVISGYDLDEVPEPANTPDAPSAPAPFGWPIWERELHHELVHEYQDKVVAGRVSAEGTALDADQSVRRFDGKGHDATYYTAAAEVARSLGFDARTFVEAL